MENRKQQLVAGWLAKATSDLEAARLFIQREHRLLDIAVFHCQQAAEKAIKAWLTSRDIVFPKTHDLEILLQLGAASEGGFARFTHHARALTPLASEFRYPGDLLEPSPERAAQALAFAEEIYAFCEQRIAAQQR
jgi:HEPN domain-containing protein